MLHYARRGLLWGAALGVFLVVVGLTWLWRTTGLEIAGEKGVLAIGTAWVLGFPFASLAQVGLAAAIRRDPSSVPTILAAIAMWSAVVANWALIGALVSTLTGFVIRRIKLGRPGGAGS